MRRCLPEPNSLPDASPYPDLAFPEPPPERPYVYLNMAMTMDGRVVVENPKPGSVLSGTAGDRRGMAQLRTAADAVMMGAGTLRSENPVVRIADEDLRERRRSEGRPQDPASFVVTNSGWLDETARFFQQPGAGIVTSKAGATRLPAPLREKAQVLTAGEDHVDLADALRQLRQEWNIQYLLVEGGPTLSYAFLKAGLADEFFLTMAPLVKAGDHIPTLIEGEAFPFDGLPRFRLISLAEENGELYLRYAFACEG